MQTRMTGHQNLRKNIVILSASIICVWIKALYLVVNKRSDHMD